MRPRAFGQEELHFTHALIGSEVLLTPLKHVANERGDFQVATVLHDTPIGFALAGRIAHLKPVSQR